MVFVPVSVPVPVSVLSLGSCNVRLGLVGPGQLDVLLQLVAGEVARALCQQLDDLHGSARLLSLGQHADSGHCRLVLRGVVECLQSVRLYRSLEDGQVVNLHGVAHQHHLAHTLHEVDEDTGDGAF